MNSDFILILNTCPDIHIARKIANELIQSNNAACVNILNSIESIYIWDGKVNQDNECLLLIKTLHSKFDLIESTILDLHPYELPEIICVDIVNGNEKYLGWISNIVQ